MSVDVVGALRTATKGLLYMSETDAPFEVVQWPKLESTLTGSEVLALLGKKAGTQINEIGVEEFFADPTQDQDWHDEAAKKVVQRYRQLLAVLRQNLTGLRVFRIGEVQIEIYVVGRTPAGGWVGIKTTAVET